jgi:hypothetical protein
MNRLLLVLCAVSLAGCGHKPLPIVPSPNRKVVSVSPACVTVYETLILFAVLACCFAVYGQGTIRVDSTDHGWKCTTNGGAEHICTDKEIRHVMGGDYIAPDRGELVNPESHKSPTREPFDETPQQWATYEWQCCRGDGIRGLCLMYPEGGSMYPEGGCPSTSLGMVEESHITCADLRRVLLTSEDQVKHCYDFTRLQ